MTKTDVFDLQSDEDVKNLARQLLALRRIAPRSLKLLVAVTAERNIKWKRIDTGEDEHPTIASLVMGRRR